MIAENEKKELKACLPLRSASSSTTTHDDYIAICMYNILALVDEHKEYYKEIGYGHNPLSVSDIAGNVLKCLAEKGNRVAITGKPT